MDNLANLLQQHTKLQNELADVERRMLSIELGRYVDSAFIRRASITDLRRWKRLMNLIERDEQ